MSFIEISGLRKCYGGRAVFEDVGFHLDQGELVTLLGPSGCGKSTLLRCIAGLLAPDAGTLRVAGADITDTPARDRGIGMVFQNYALFPKLSVRDNVAFGLRMQRRPAAEIDARVADVLAMVDLDGCAKAYPGTLSGGQQQRVALARSLVVRPRILLLDEPLSALDAAIRRALRQELRDIQRRAGVTMIVVTHDQEEALGISDRILVMQGGRIVQQGSPEDIYTRPLNEGVARFIGHHNVLDADAARAILGRDIRGHVAIRPESIELSAAVDPLPSAIAATVVHSQLLGNVVRYRTSAAGRTLYVDQLNRRAADLIPDGTRVQLLISAADVQELAP